MHRVSTEQLLDHAGWVRQLARRLVSDAEAAEDLAQEALVVALERPPNTPAIKAWYRRVLSNFVHQNARSERRRRARERSRATAATCDSTLEAVSRLASHRALVDAVEALAEPYRTAILLRYFDDLPPRKIAAKLDVPIKTVDSRLHRGLQQLRAALRDKQGPDRDWRTALSPLCGAPTPVSLPTFAGAVVMGTKIKLSVAAAVAAGCVWWWWPSADETEPRALAHAESTRPVDSGRGGPSNVSSTSPARGRTRVAEPGRTGRASSTVPTRSIRGRVVDVEAAPLADVELEFRPRQARGVAFISGPSGYFEATVPDLSGDIYSADDAYVTVMSGQVTRNDDADSVVVLARPVDLAGIVVDEHGEVVQNAALTVWPPDDLVTRFDDVLESSRVRRFATTTTRDGSFQLPATPYAAGARLITSHPSYDTAEMELPPASDLGVRIELRRPAKTKGTLTGRVLDPRGAPAPDARVAIGLLTTVTDARGEFQLDLARALSPDVLTAVKPGYLPGTLRRPADGGPRAGWPEHVELDLGGPPLSIDGRVVRADGRALEGAKVWIADPSLFGLVHGLPVQTEALMSGANVIDAPEPSEHPEDVPAGAVFDVMSMPSQPSASWHWAETDGAGQFALDGLAPRDYTLHVLDPSTLELQAVGPIPAGSSGVTVDLPLGRLHPELVGRVVSRAGSALPGIRVAVQRRSFGVRLLTRLGTLDSSAHSRGQVTYTDADGRFALRDVPKSGVYLTARGESILSNRREVRPDDLDDDIEIRVDARCHLKLEIDPTIEAVLVLDADGQRLDVTIERGGEVDMHDRIELHAGKSGIIAISEAAATLVLMRGGEAVARRAIQPTPGEVTVVR